MPMSRLIIISNRLPVSVAEKHGEIVLKPSAGGLATGLRSLATQHELIWIGWPGVSVSNQEKKRKIKSLLGEQNMFPVFIDKEKFANYYNGFSNSTLWPLFHYFQQYTVFKEKTWVDYKSVNNQFAEALFKIAQPNDIFWVQDYQLMLVPDIIRKKYPKSTIGFFLHIPFPSYELMRTLPWREDLLRGVLGSDLIGFHTFDYARHFASAISRILGYDDLFLGRVRFKNRVVDIDSFPMGIDYQRYADAALEKESIKEAKRYRESVGDEQIILAIDRLDYSKALPQRLHAYDLFLTKYPEFRRKVSMLIILVPSRDSVGRYKSLKEEIDKLVGFINSKYGRIDWAPIKYYYRSIKFSRLIAWYKLAPVALITPFRDGMNLVSKEYLATKHDGKGVLVLSEMAGSAKELVGAIQVNPNNLDDIAEGIYRALTMPESEQINRNRKMQKMLARNNVNQWAGHFLERLKEAHDASTAIYQKHFTTKVAREIITKYKKTKARLIFLDYDGTLVNFRSHPNSASPTKQLYSVLTKLTADDSNTVVLISGRDKNILEEWFGELHLDIVAEHGSWYKHSDSGWEQFRKLDTSWKKELIPVFEKFVDRTPGSFLEEKNYSLAWHFRKSDPGLAHVRQHEFMERLTQLISGKNLQIMEGNKVLEVKNFQNNKGAAARHWLKAQTWPFILAIGDDYTDEDTFKVLPGKNACSVKVGFNNTAADYNIDSVEEVLNFLEKLAK
jgi:trehalose 6-phosphate synthase/phosphatase